VREVARLNSSKSIRLATAVAVSSVAAFAAVISYDHIYDLARQHGGTVLAARLLPLSVDGLILAMSLVMLHEARHGDQAPALARCMLGLGVAATVAANVTYGVAFGVLGAIIWAWPAVAFVGAVEVDLLMVRKARRESRGNDLGDALWAGVPTDAQNAAVTALRATLTAGNPLSLRQLETRFGLSRTEATKVRQSVMAETNGSHQDEG
jgi:Protein of unknown function (DUF2637)